MASKEKIEFVKKNYPELSKINPYMDHAFCIRVKKDLIDAGLYTRGAKHLYDTAIENIILKAQGKRTNNRRATTGTRI